MLNGGKPLKLKDKPSLTGALYLYPYEPWMGVDLGNAVRALKYQEYFGLAKVLAGLMFDCMEAQFSYAGGNVIVPIPLHSSRQRERGFNQSELIAGELSSLLNIPCEQPLKRNKNTQAQAELSSRERELNVKGAFSLKKGAVVEAGNIILLDDQITTGSTINNAAKVLLNSGAKRVYTISVTH